MDASLSLFHIRSDWRRGKKEGAKAMEIRPIRSDEGLRLRALRLHALSELPDGLRVNIGQ